VPRTGTLPLTVSAACGPPSRGQRNIPWPSLSGRQVLLFHASACSELTPPLHRAPPGQHAGHPLAEGTPPRRAEPGGPDLHHWHSTVRAGDLLHRLTPLSGHTADRRV